jgi:hypothetical protein
VGPALAENRIDLSVLSDVAHKRLKDLDVAIGSILTVAGADEATRFRRAVVSEGAKA